MHNTYWKNMYNSLYIDNRIERTKLRMLQNEPAGKFFFLMWNWLSITIRTLVNFENFSGRLCYRNLSTIELNCFKNGLDHVALLTEIFFLITLPWELLFLLEEDNWAAGCNNNHINKKYSIIELLKSNRGWIEIFFIKFILLTIKNKINRFFTLEKPCFSMHNSTKIG